MGTSDTSGQVTYRPPGRSPDPLQETDLGYILLHLIPEISRRMKASSEHYGAGNHRALGPAGQFSDIWRKIGPLKRALWEGKELPRESPREICMDLIGHCLLTVAMLDREVER